MFKKETEYALRALVCVQVENKKGRLAGIAGIAREIEAPQFFYSKNSTEACEAWFCYVTQGQGRRFFL